MIIYGSRMYFKSNVVRSVGECQYCGAWGRQVSYQASKFGHIYFIPLIPMGAKSQVLNECASCNMGTHIKVADLGPVVDSVTDQFKSWIMAIQDGKTEIIPEGGEEPVNVGVLIAGIVEDLYCLKEIEGIESISAVLNANNLSYENNIVEGRWNEIQGDLEGAKLSYIAAHRVRPKDLVALYQIGMTEVKLGNTTGAEDAFAKYLALSPNDIGAYVELASLYEGQKDYPKIVQAYDKIYELNPDVISDRGMKKVYKKACKKSGVQGKYLNQV